jgi:hypothetical protein
MSKLQHTPGPWKSYNTEPVETELDIVIESQFSTIGWLYSGKENSEANARLITAAPEMLNELIKIYTTMYMTQRECYWMPIKDVIEKATGMSIDEVISL